jgi:hypothetical protein
VGAVPGIEAALTALAHEHASRCTERQRELVAAAVELVRAPLPAPATAAVVAQSAPAAPPAAFDEAAAASMLQSMDGAAAAAVSAPASAERDASIELTMAMRLAARTRDTAAVSALTCAPSAAAIVDIWGALVSGSLYADAIAFAGNARVLWRKRAREQGAVRGCEPTMVPHSPVFTPSARAPAEQRHEEPCRRVLPALQAGRRVRRAPHGSP